MAKVRKGLAIVKKYGTLVGLFLVTFLIILSLLLPKSQFQQAKESLAENPYDFEAHLILAEEYLRNNQINEAEKELLLAQEIQSSNLQLQTLWQKKMAANPEEIRQLIEAWEKVIKEKPDYRDAYLQLALLHYRICETDQAQAYLEKALNLDPNFEPAKEMKEALYSKN